MSLAPGDRLGHYDILAAIGKGGMGDVYSAHDSRLRRDVAIKVSREQFTERFAREARVVASLNHPNICTVFDVGPNYLVMELIDGGTLADRLRQGPTPVEEALRIAGQIAEALQAAHEKGVTHRDLKPGNIKIRPDGTVKVLDFGLAKVGGIPGVNSDDSPTLTLDATLAGAILGTAAYMSPEQARGKPVDRRSDIYAFGVVLYETVTGERLHRGESLSDTLADVIKQEPDLSRVPFEVRRLLASCLRKDPQQRLHDIADWKLLLDEPRAEAAVPFIATRVSWGWPAAVGVPLVALLGLGFVHYRETPEVAQEVRLQIPKPDDLTFNVGTQAAISPDGKWLAFPAIGADGLSRYYLRGIDSLDVRALPGSEGLIATPPPPFWSYDSRFVVYGAQNKLKKNEISGVPAQTIADTGEPYVQGGSWNADGMILYARDNGKPIMKVSANGGKPEPVTRLDAGETAHRWAQFLPDGHRFIYLRYTGSLETAGIYVGSIDVKPDAQNHTMITPANTQAWWLRSPLNGKTYLITQREATLLAQPFDTETATLSGAPEAIASGVGAFVRATAGLWSVARNGAFTYRGGGAAQPRLIWRGSTGTELGVANEPNDHAFPAVSPDGTRIAYRLRDAQGNDDIWVKDLAHGNKIQLTLNPGPDTSPVWSPDGTRIVYAGNRGGHLDLYEKDADGSGAERLLWKSDEDKVPYSWREGTIAFSSISSETDSDLWLISTAPGAKAQVVLRTNFEEMSPAISPDGRWIAYSSSQSNRSEIYVRPVHAGANPEGDGWTVSMGGGRFPAWSNNRLYYLSLTGDLDAVDVVPGTPSFQSGPPHRLFGGLPPRSWAIDLVNNRFLFVQEEEALGAPAPFTVVLNWVARLKQ